MSSAISTTVFEHKQRKVAKSGNTAVIYVPSEARDYLRVGDYVTIRMVVEGNQLTIVASKPLYKFGIQDIKNLANEHNFKINYDKILGKITVFEATRNNFSLSYTQNRDEKVLPAYVTISAKFLDIDHDTYKSVSYLAMQLKKKFDVVTRPEGDLDTINVLKEPERYKLNKEKAIKLLKEANKKIGITITISFNNKKNELDEVKSALSDLMKLDSKLVPK